MGDKGTGTGKKRQEGEKGEIGKGGQPTARATRSSRKSAPVSQLLASGIH